MIRIRRPRTVPPSLKSKGTGAARRLRRDYDSGIRKFAFDSRIYGASDVKSALIAAQNKKCAYCESWILHVQHGDIEHYRPKGGYERADGSGLEQPGYYWLAYTWDNLLLACAICNQSRKRNHFPLQRESRRARDHNHDLSREEPLLIDPAGPTVDPIDHIEFREEIPFPKRRSRKGTATIEILGLSREKLNEVRRDRLATIRTHIKFYRFLKQLKPGEHTPTSRLQLQELKSDLKRRASSAHEYSAMFRCVFRRLAPEFL